MSDSAQMTNRVCVTFMIIWTVTCSSMVRASAAEWRRGGSNECTIEAVGAIETGDKDALEKLLKRAATGEQIKLCLDSPGGSYSQAMAAIELIQAHDEGVATRVPAGAECLSACALIFLAGNGGRGRDGRRLPLRELDARATLGFHGPYVRTGTVAPDQKIEQDAFRAGLRAIGRLLEMGEENMFPSELLIGALQKGADEFLYVDTVGKAGEWSIDIVGYTKPAALTVQMLQTACRNDTVWKFGIDSDAVATKVGPAIQLKQGRFRGVYPGYGDEGTFHCTIDVFRDASGEFYLDLILGDPKAKADGVPSPAALEQAVKAIKPGQRRPGKPLWYAFHENTRLGQIAVPR